MVSDAPTAIDDDLRGILENLTEGVFPLAPWIEGKTKNDGYKPRRHVPWREKGKSLSPKDLGAVTFFEELLERSVDQDPLVTRFAEVIADPFRFSPLLEGMPDWRESRGLDPTATFGIVTSQNVLAIDERTPVTRAQFYGTYWSLLKQAVADADPKTPADWEGLAHDLMLDSSPHWPGGQPMKSSTFVKQLGRDLLHAMLNMRNPAADPWRVAFLEELGEHRRVGNSFTRDDADRFVDAFRERIR